MAANANLIRGWLKMLGALNVGAMQPEEFEWRINALAPALAAEFEDTVFTPASVRYVASKCRFFPTYGEIHPLLKAWQTPFPPLEEPHNLLLPAPPQPERSPEEINHVTKLANEVVAALRHHETEKEAYYANAQPDWRKPAPEMTRAQLNEAYKRAGIKGPELPKPPHLRVVPPANTNA